MSSIPAGTVFTERRVLRHQHWSSHVENRDKLLRNSRVPRNKLWKLPISKFLLWQLSGWKITCKPYPPDQSIVYCWKMWKITITRPLQYRRPLSRRESWIMVTGYPFVSFIIYLFIYLSFLTLHSQIICGVGLRVIGWLSMLYFNGKLTHWKIKGSSQQKILLEWTNSFPMHIVLAYSRIYILNSFKSINE